MRFFISFFSMEWLRVFDFLAPLAIRFLMAPILWVSGSERIGLFSANTDVMQPLTWVSLATIQANAQSFPDVIGIGATGLVMTLGIIEVICAVLLAFGLATRWAALALMLLLVVLMIVALGNSNAVPNVQEMVWNHGYVVQQHSQFEILMTYFVLMLALFFMGAGRWFSLDWFIYRHFTRQPKVIKDEHEFDPFEIDATDEQGFRLMKE